MTAWVLSLPFQIVMAVVAESYSYDVYGEPSGTGSVGNPYMFTGRRYDGKTGSEAAMTQATSATSQQGGKIENKSSRC